MANTVRSKMEEWLTNVELTRDWHNFEDAVPDQFRDTDWPWYSSPWARLINGKRVAVVLSHEGKTHPHWRLFVDGKFVRTMADVLVHFGSGEEAIIKAEEEVSIMN